MAIFFEKLNHFVVSVFWRAVMASQDEIKRDYQLMSIPLGSDSVQVDCYVMPQEHELIQLELIEVWG